MLATNFLYADSELDGKMGVNSEKTSILLLAKGFHSIKWVPQKTKNMIATVPTRKLGSQRLSEHTKKNVSSPSYCFLATPIQRKLEEGGKKATTQKQNAHTNPLSTCPEQLGRSYPL